MRDHEHRCAAAAMRAVLLNESAPLSSPRALVASSRIRMRGSHQRPAIAIADTDRPKRFAPFADDLS